MKNRVFAIFLILILILPALGSWMYLSYQKQRLRKEVKSRIIKGMSNDELQLLVFSETEADNLKWEHAKEFEYQGKMYDVVRSEEKDGFIFYWCWLDNEETAINSKIDDAIALLLGSNEQRKEKSENLQKFYKSLYTQYIFTIIIKPIVPQTALKNRFIADSQSFFCGSPPTPPPRNFYGRS